MFNMERTGVGGPAKLRIGPTDRFVAGSFENYFLGSEFNIDKMFLGASAIK
jgi:hypothetical protein